MTDDLSTTPCPNKHTAVDVIYAERMIRLGWWCPVCNWWQDAIRRERLVDKPEGIETWKSY